MSDRADNLNATVARMFYEERMSYGCIAKQLNLTKKQVKNKVKLGLGSLTPQLARQHKGNGNGTVE